MICEEERRENAGRIEREISLEMYYEKTRNCKKRKERITGEETITLELKISREREKKLKMI